MSIGLDRVPSPKNMGTENERESNFGGTGKRSSRPPIDTEAYRKSTDKGLSSYLGFSQTQQTESDAFSKPNMTNENINPEVFTLGPAHRSITELFDEANQRVALSPMKMNGNSIDETLTPRKSYSYKVSSVAKSPNPRKSTQEERLSHPQRFHETKSFEAVRREVHDIQKELERANREQDSPYLSRKYSEAATPYDKKAPVSKTNQMQYNAENVSVSLNWLSSAHAIGL